MEITNTGEVLVENIPIKLSNKHIDTQAKYAAKYAIDLAANNTRDLMEEMALDKFSIKRKWTGAKQPTGYRARNAKINGGIDPSLPIRHTDGATMTAGAFSGEEADWIERQQQGGVSQSDITPVYERQGGKINKGRGGANSRFDVAGGVREVFGKTGKSTSRKGLKHALQNYSKRKNGKRVVKIKNTWYRVNDTLYKKLLKSGGSKSAAFKAAFKPIFYRGGGKYRVKKLTRYEDIFNSESKGLVSSFVKRFEQNINKSIEKRLK